MPDQQSCDDTANGQDGADDDQYDAQARHALHRPVPGSIRGKRKAGKGVPRLTLGHLRMTSTPSHPAFQIDPDTRRVLIDPDMAPLAPRYRAYIPIARFLANVLEQKPNARIRVSASDTDEVIGVPAGASPEQLTGLVSALLRQSGKTDPDAKAGTNGAPGTQPSRLLVEIDGPNFPPATGASTAHVTIYLSDEAVHNPVEAAVELLLASVGLEIKSQDEPIIGSWFRRMRAGLQAAAESPAGREAILTATHVADSRLILAQDAYVTATLLQNLGPVIQSLHPTKDAVLRVGALLIVKVDWAVQVFQLTAAQQALLDHQPQLATKPHEIIAALQLSASEQEAVPLVSEPQRPLTER